MDWDRLSDPQRPYGPHPVYAMRGCAKCGAKPKIKHRARVYKLLGQWFWVCRAEHCWAAGVAKGWPRALADANRHAQREG